MTATIAREYRILMWDCEEEVIQKAFLQAENLSKKLKSQQNVPRLSRRIQGAALKMIKELVQQEYRDKDDQYYRQLIELSEVRWLTVFSHNFQKCVQEALLGNLTCEDAVKLFNHGRIPIKS